MKFLKKLILLFIFIIVVSNSYSLEQGTCLNLEVTSINPGSVEVNQEFTLGVHVESCGEKIPENISLEILNIPQEIKVKEKEILEIPRMYYSNSERFIIYHMRTTDNVQPGKNLIKLRLKYYEGETLFEKDYEIEINVIAEEAKINIASVKTDPVLPYENDKIELTLRIENFGDGSANSIKVYADHKFEGTKESFLGTLSPKEDGPIIFTFISKESGEFNIPITISYNDDFGEKEIKKEVSIVILKKESNYNQIIFFSVLFLLIIMGLIYFFKMKKSKEKIIHQLLKGENLKEQKK